MSCFNAFPGFIVWGGLANSTDISANRDKLEVGKYLTKYNILFGGNSLYPLNPVDSNPIGVET